jgi:spermidine/putrescine transport system permease protein
MNRRALGIYGVFFYLFLYFPLLIMLAFSFNNARRNVVWRGFTFKWYGRLFHDTELLWALATSLKLALAAAAVASLLGLLASYALARHRRFRGRGFYAGLFNLPLMIPEIVMGVGLLSFFAKARIPLTFWTLAASHALIALPYSIGTIRGRLLLLKDSRLEEAAMDLGATEWVTFLKVTLPLAWPSILAGALLAFTVSFEDFVTTFFVAGVGVVTMPIKIYSMMKFGVTPEINALAVCLLIFAATALGLNHLSISNKTLDSEA